MNATQWITYASLFLVGGLIGYFAGSYQRSPTAEAPATQAEALRNISAPQDSAEAPAQAPPATVEVSETEPEPEEEPAPTPVEVVSGPAIEAGCYSGEALSRDLTLLSERMERDSLWYDSKNPSRLQDCSGIFHQIIRHIAQKCDRSIYPTPGEARSTRALARWYQGIDGFTVVNDPMAMRKQIRPGSVMFFGKSGQRYENLTAEMLAAEYPHHIITHIGIVTEVSYDDAGEVKGYVMMHGRREGVIAQRSHYHSVEPPRLGYPILGNWNQQWVGLAYAMPQPQATVAAR